MKKLIRTIAILAIGTGAYLYFFTETFTSNAEVTTVDTLKADSLVVALTADTASADTTKK